MARVELGIPDDMVGDDDGGEDGESLLGVEGHVVLIAVDARQLYFVARPTGVAQIAHQNGVLRTWQSTSRNLYKKRPELSSLKC